ncbi:MAG: acetate--CoA ligase family protein [Thermoanaerobaculia bacterium]|nr:acetate--CoA ligase family protein [Thermoanaerobaculia bacterium]
MGASRNQRSIGYAIVHNLLANGFTGAVFPVNPQARVVHSLKCYPSICDVPDPIDLAVIVVPKQFVEAVVEDCIATGVRGLVIISAGFAETGEVGAAVERRILDRVRSAGIRMVGPNCMGVSNTDPAISLDATFAPVTARRGSVGFVSQSGALGIAILNEAAALGIGLTQFVSVGNKADVSGNDLLEMWHHDDDTRVICMYLESFGNPRRFTEIAKLVGRKKPVIVVKSGRTDAGARAASSHTGALAGLDVTVSAFLAQCGVLRANTMAELFDVARALDRCPLPDGPRVAIVTNAGGPGIMATDACVNLDLELAELSDATRDELSRFLPAEASLGNPVDMIASASPESYRRSLEVVLADPGVDMAIVVNVTPLLEDPSEVLAAATEGAAATDDQKPVLAVMMASEDFYSSILGRDDLLPVYRFPEPAAVALSKLERYASWRRRPHEVPPIFEVDEVRVDEILLARGEGYLPPRQTFELLDAYGIPCVAWRRVDTAAAAVEAAEELGYPVVLKAIASDLIHKSDAGGVAIDLRSSAEVTRAAESMIRSLEAVGHAPEAFLLQRYEKGGQEVIFGISTDLRFGPLLMFGLGGKYVEVFRDVKFAVTPLTKSEARDVIGGLRGHALLEGVRGDEAVDGEALVEILLRLAQLSVRHPRITELDINPFLARPRGTSSLALDARVLVGAPVRSGR